MGFLKSVRTCYTHKLLTKKFITTIFFSLQQKNFRLTPPSITGFPKLFLQIAPFREFKKAMTIAPKDFFFICNFRKSSISFKITVIPLNLYFCFYLQLQNIQYKFVATFFKFLPTPPLWETLPQSVQCRDLQPFFVDRGPPLKKSL